MEADEPGAYEVIQPWLTKAVEHKKAKENTQDNDNKHKQQSDGLKSGWGSKNRFSTLPLYPLK